MKVIAISFSGQSEEFINSLRSLEFLDEFYIASSSKNKNANDQNFNKINVKEFIQQNWRKIDLFLFWEELAIYNSSKNSKLLSEFKNSSDCSEKLIATTFNLKFWLS